MKITKRFPLTFVLMVLVPGILGTWYYQQVMSDQFEAEAHFIIQGNDKSNGDMFAVLTGLPGGRGGSAKDALVIKDFILSKAFLSKIQQTIDVRSHFSSPIIDIFSQIPKDYSYEEFYEYWLDFITLEHDSLSGIMALKVTAFNPDIVIDIANFILKESDDLVNRLSTESEKDALEFAQRELDKAEAKLTKSRLSMLRFRNEALVVDIKSTIRTQSEVVSKLEMLLSKQEAELIRIQTYLQPNSIQVKALKREVIALKQQIYNEKKRWVPKKQKDKGSALALNEKITRYEELLVDQKFAEKVYEMALIAIEQARLDAKTKHRYLVTIVEPQRPQSSTKPERMWETIKLWVACLLIWGIFSLMLSSIKDHSGFA